MSVMDPMQSGESGADGEVEHATLSRRFGEYTRHTVSESWGSRSAWNVGDDAQAFFTALTEGDAAQ